MKTVPNYKIQQIDADGYLISNGVRLEDSIFARAILSNLTIAESKAWVSNYEEQLIYIEAFDDPLVIYDVERPERNAAKAPWKLKGPYDFEATFSLDTLVADEWDRFHGETHQGVTFVFSRPAQSRFFDLVDDLEDDGFMVDGVTFKTNPWLPTNPEVRDERFWYPYYQTEKAPPWDLEGPHEAIAQLLAQLKIPKSRIAVLGAGRSHDAAFLAEQGHIVTAVDISKDAIEKARHLYGSRPNLNFEVADIFNLPHSWDKSFDYVFEHTCYCAIPPERRNELVKVWRRLLTEEGQLFGIFFCFENFLGPPYGGSEWEIRERLKKSFQFNYWTRWHHSIERRRGIELIVSANRL